jgi:hypothetical protein
MATATLCAHAQTPSRRAQRAVRRQRLGQITLLGRQLLVNSSDWNEVARFNKLGRPQPDRRWPEVDILIRFLRSTPP